MQSTGDGIEHSPLNPLCGTSNSEFGEILCRQYQAPKLLFKKYKLVG